MSALTCDGCRGLLVGDAIAADNRPEVTAHLSACPGCRAFAEALRAGEQAWLAEDEAALRDGVIARTSLADALAQELRGLAEMDPGPGFTARVLRHTSQRPAAERWRAGWAAGWRALVRRPRFAWEAAYVVTLCIVLAVGNPVSAWEWGSQKASSIAQRSVAPAATSLRQDLEAWRAAFAPGARGQSVATTDEPSSAFEEAWAWASSGVGDRVLQLVDAFLGLWERIAAWFHEPPPAAAPPPTEPRGASPRSPQ
jgi:hypothetical protein